MAPVPPAAAPDEVEVAAAQIRTLDLAPLRPLAALAPEDLLARAGRLRLAYEWPRDEDDPRELSEIPELRLWTLRADALHPWLPLLLERSAGTLTRHVAMLLPHAFSRSEGIRFAPESLDLWITHRLFLLDEWSRRAGLDCRGNLSQMAAVLGFELDPAFWSSLPGGPSR
ncbi:MAG: CRR6 family NdhI maturation factor [Synechococcaceae cyanobacterium]|nr:CRR6 family NdhI maturation factor [Synechococcaceae cyanobacterium]